MLRKDTLPGALQIGRPASIAMYSDQGWWLGYMGLNSEQLGRHQLCHRRSCRSFLAQRCPSMFSMPQVPPHILKAATET